MSGASKNAARPTLSGCDERNYRPLEHSARRPRRPWARRPRQRRAARMVPAPCGSGSPATFTLIVVTID